MASRKASTRRSSRSAGGSGRITPKGTRPGTRSSRSGDQPSTQPAEGSGRYTPPIPKESLSSPRWVPILMFSLLGIGALIIIVNYLGFLPGDADSGFLLLGLALITGGFITATQYR